MMIKAFNCCGVKEMSGISARRKAEDVLVDICTPRPVTNWDNMEGIYYLNANKQEMRLNFAFLIFTEARDGGYGRNLADYILAQKLGSITESDVRTNLNSSNRLKVYIWGVDFEALTAWKEKHAKYTPPGEIVVAPPVPGVESLNSILRQYQKLQSGAAEG